MGCQKLGYISLMKQFGFIDVNQSYQTVEFHFNIKSHSRIHAKSEEAKRRADDAGRIIKFSDNLA